MVGVDAANVSLLKVQRSSPISMSRLPQVAQAQRQPYPNDLSDAEWAALAPLFPQPKGFGHPRTEEIGERKENRE